MRGLDDCRTRRRKLHSRCMVRTFAAACFFLALTSAAWAQAGPRSYVFNGMVRPDECKILPQAAFEIMPSLGRSGSKERLGVKCGPIADGTILLTLTFQLTDSPPPLPRAEARRYSFRWSAKLGHHLNPVAGEFTHDGARCNDIVTFFAKYADAKDPNVGPSWVGGC